MNAKKLFIYSIIMIFIPPTRLFGFKRFLLRWCGANVGSNVRIVSSVKFNITGPLTIGDDTWIGHDVLLVGGNAPITIGARCDIAPRVTLVTGTHKINTSGDRVAGDGYSLPIVIGDGNWICTSAIILGGTTIQNYCLITSGAIVKDSFPSKCMISGIPAKNKKNYTFSDFK